jgi:hypothetical protein
MTFLLILSALGFTTPAQAADAPAKNCFWAFGHYLVVDNSGQNLILEIEGEECQYLNIAYGDRSNNKLTFKLENGGWEPLPKIGGPLPNEPKGKYKLNWAERSISIEAEIEREEGIHCTWSAGFGYDTYVPESSSFTFKSVSQCTGEEKVESEAKIYGF